MLCHPPPMEPLGLYKCLLTGEIGKIKDPEKKLQTHTHTQSNPHQLPPPPYQTKIEGLLVLKQSYFIGNTNSPAPVEEK